jgi:hypothetical protein
MNRFSVDPKSYELAEHFLPNDAPDSIKRELAQLVQDAVEGYTPPACSACFNGARCVRLSGHEGPHEWTEEFV